MIGDKHVDVEVGRRAGAKSVLVRTGYGEEELKKHPNSRLPAELRGRQSPSRSRSHSERTGEMTRLRSLLGRFKNKRVVVFGDLVADVFVYGEISRISRRSTGSDSETSRNADRPRRRRERNSQPEDSGSAADSGRHRGRRLRKAIDWCSIFTRLKIDISGIRVAKSYRTPTKMRILAGAVHSQRQQIVRMDSGDSLHG